MLIFVSMVICVVRVAFIRLLSRRVVRVAFIRLLSRRVVVFV